MDDPISMEKDPRDLPGNKGQAVRHLESTERRLLMNPVQAATYNHKIAEMEEMSFSCKLSEKEINDYKGPVHYISHHAVLRPEGKVPQSILCLTHPLHTKAISSMTIGRKVLIFLMVCSELFFVLEKSCLHC